MTKVDGILSNIGLGKTSFDMKLWDDKHGDKEKRNEVICSGSQI